MSAPVTLGASFDSGSPVPLFDAPLPRGDLFRQYDASRDGSRFLLNHRADADFTRPITFVQNWTSSLAH